MHDFEPFIGPCRYGTVDIHIHKIFGTALPNDSVTSQISATGVKQWTMMISLENPNESVLNNFSPPGHRRTAKLAKRSRAQDIVRMHYNECKRHTVTASTHYDQCNRHAVSRFSSLHLGSFLRDCIFYCFQLHQKFLTSRRSALTFRDSGCCQ